MSPNPAYDAILRELPPEWRVLPPRTEKGQYAPLIEEIARRGKEAGAPWVRTVEKPNRP